MKTTVGMVRVAAASNTDALRCCMPSLDTDNLPSASASRPSDAGLEEQEVGFESKAQVECCCAASVGVVT
ncbi:MAG: hypothetical protein CM15mP128_4720 [Methanobacteriota archaeon]|nr:MAG: hypothetical protein CM15mP128_4720 [Euryarchaeota archaeon]